MYIDPPFNSKRDYNIFSASKEIQTQRIAFEDTWTLKNIQDSLTELHTLEHEKLWSLLIVYQKVAPHAFPYLTMMALRLLELHSVLKPTGSFYLHCDPTMSHYLKTVCDVIFGKENLRNELIWHYQRWPAKQKNFQQMHDVIFFYSKRYRENTFNIFYEELSKGTLKRWKGKKSLVEFEGDIRLVTKMTDETSPGRPSDDVWDIPVINSQAKERLGYPTQKPKALLERIIKASSNEGDVVLDAFCGCGFTIDAAEGLHRLWIGIDISPVVISLIKRRLQNTYKKGLSKFEVRGITVDESSALKLWKENPFAFQDWWISEFEVFSSTFGTKGADKGLDGIGLYEVDTKGKTVRVGFQVKGGETVQSKDIDALLRAMDKQKCELGIFLTAAEPTKPMLETATSAGFVKVPGFEYTKLQIITLEEYFKGKRPKLPTVNITFKAAQHTGKKSKGQIILEV